MEKLSDILFSPISLKDLEAMIENCVRRVFYEVNIKKEDDIMTIDEASYFVNLKKPTVYQLVSERKIPFMKRSKKLYFSKDDLTRWIKDSSRKPIK